MRVNLQSYHLPAVDDYQGDKRNFADRFLIIGAEEEEIIELSIDFTGFLIATGALHAAGHQNSLVPQPGQL